MKRWKNNDNTNDMPAIPAKDKLMCNYMRLERISLFYAHYVFIDNVQYHADQIFIDHRLRVYFGREYAKKDSNYRVIFCKVKKSEADIFEKCMKVLCEKIMAEENGSYEEACRLFETEGNRGSIDNYG